MKFYLVLFIGLIFQFACSDDASDSGTDPQGSAKNLTEIISDEFKIYVSDAGNFDDPPWQILKYDHDGSNPQVFIDEELAWPQDILFLEDANEVLISNLNSNTITRYDASSGAYIDDFATGISGPTRMRVGPDGFLYVLQWSGNGRVVRLSMDGESEEDFTTLNIPQSIGLDWDGAGNLYVASFARGSIQKFDPSGEALEVIGTTELLGPTNVWIVQDRLYVNDWTAGQIKVFDLEGELMETLASGLSQVEGVAVVSEQYFLIGHGRNASVKCVSVEGDIEVVVDTRSGGLIRPNAVVLRKE